MFYVLCPLCHVGIEIPATADGPDCSECSNVGNCPACDEAFFFDARDVIDEAPPHPTPCS